MQKHEYAVSPVVGVMLMLIVTIIIAAIVSAFAGGTLGTTQKTPTATIQATYSQMYGMTISHGGGDPIPLDTTTIIVRPTKSFGSDASRYSWTVNKSYVYTNSTQNLRTARALIPGDTASISAGTNLTYVQQRPDGSTENPSHPEDASYWFDNSQNVGLSFELQFVDSGGNTISKSVVTISR